jgi:hypothetical protein
MISIHVGYLYISFSSTETPWKWGTFIEATIASANYLPYSSSDDNDKFYQSLLFYGCVYPTIEWTDIVYREELCSVTTDNYQVFTVSVIPWQYWSDGSEITLNDVYFTYKTILRDNYRNLPFLEWFRNILITPDIDERTLTVTFPSPSIDNMIFFTNFILPAHHVANIPYESYIKTFFTNPIHSTCAKLQQWVTNRQHTVFDLWACTNTLLRFYQVRTFDTQEEADEYIRNNPTIIDLVLSDSSFPGYTPNNVILNRYLTFFFNTHEWRVNPTLRRNLAALIQWITTEFNDNTIYARDHYLFDAVAPSTDTAWIIEYFTPPPQEAQEEILPRELPALPSQLVRRTQDHEELSFVIDEDIEERTSLQLVFNESFDRISVTANQWVEYFPSSYNKVTQSALYNLSPIFRNIQQWRNTYTIRWYLWDLHTETFTFHVYYLQQPTTTRLTTPVVTPPTPLEILYYTNHTSELLIDKLRTFFEQEQISQHFSLEWFSDVHAFEWKIVSWDFDIVMRSINIGLRKDISNLFMSTTPATNPSRYTNEQLASLINRFFLANDTQRQTIKQEIDAIYINDVPVVIVWKELGTVSIREALDFAYPERVYVLWWRRDFIDQINIFNHVSINRDTVFRLDNFFAFIWQAF